MNSYLGNTSLVRVSKPSPPSRDSRRWQRTRRRGEEECEGGIWHFMLF